MAIEPGMLLQTLLSGVLLGGYYALMASGLTVTFGTMKVVNLAHGHLILIGAYIAYVFYLASQITNPLVSAILAMPALALIGVFIYVVLIRPIGGIEVNTILVTIGTMLFLESMMMMGFGDRYRGIPSVGAPIVLGTVYLTIPRLATFVIATLTVILLDVMIMRSYPGKAVRATMLDREAATLMGVDVNRIELIVFVAGVALCGLAGSLYALLYSIYPSQGVVLVFKSFVITVFAGGGNIRGAYVAGIFLGVVELMTALLIGPTYVDFIVYAVFLLVLIIRPSGLLARD